MVIRALDLITIGAAVVVATAVAFPPADALGDERAETPVADHAASGTQATPAALATLDALVLAGSAASFEPQAASAEPLPTRPARRPSVNPQLAKQCLEVAGEIDPVLAERLEALQRRSDGADFDRAIRNARHLVGLARLKEHDPQLYDVKVQELRIDAEVTSVLGELAEARRTGSAAAADLEAGLHDLVRHQVAYSITARGMYLLRLQENLNSLRDQLAHDSANFDQAVERRMRQLLDETPGGTSQG